MGSATELKLIHYSFRFIVHLDIDDLFFRACMSLQYQYIETNIDRCTSLVAHIYIQSSMHIAVELKSNETQHNTSWVEYLTWESLKSLFKCLFASRS